jgi:membrane associated rhomboid family serine protease
VLHVIKFLPDQVFVAICSNRCAFTASNMVSASSLLIHVAEEFCSLIFTCQWLCRLEKMGALEWDKVVHGHQGWRLITCMWLHAGVVHVLANMLSLIFIGIRLEQQFGFGMSCSLLLSIYISTCWLRAFFTC